MDLDAGSPALDARYRPLEGAEAWDGAGAVVDGAAWRGALDRLGALDAGAGPWMDMVRRGALLAAAYHSGARAGLYHGDDGLARALLAGVAPLRRCGPAAGPHVLANHAALVLAGEVAGGRTEPSEGWLRRLHAVACAPQATHPVPGAHGVHDHVLGHGDYKHHPNHATGPTGGLRVLAPVAMVGREAARVAEQLRGPSLASLHPQARAAYAVHAVTHVGPFAAGNGRVARAAGSVPLLGAAGLPLVVPGAGDPAYRAALAAAGAGDPVPLVDFVGARLLELVDLVAELRGEASGRDEASALAAWEERVAAAHRLHALLRTGVHEALARHSGRADLGWLSDLSAAAVVADRPADETRFRAVPLTVRVAQGQAVVEERLSVDAHPVDADPEMLVLRAHEAGLRLDVATSDLRRPGAADLRARLDGLLDRAVTALAVRVAAESEGD